MAFATQADLEVAVGGPKKLLQLADFGGVGSLADSGVQAIIVSWLDLGAARVRAAVEVKHEPEVIAALDAESRTLLRGWNADLSARVAYERGTGGQGMPESVGDRAERAERDLDRVAAGSLRLGRSSGGTAAGINQPAGVIDHDPKGTAMSVRGMRYSGFR